MRIVSFVLEYLVSTKWLQKVQQGIWKNRLNWPYSPAEHMRPIIPFPVFIAQCLKERQYSS